MLMGSASSLVLALAIGVVLGLLAGLLGIGGGAIMIPVFRLIFGLSPVVATASSLFAVFPIALFGVISRIRGKTALPALGVCLGLGGALTSPAGVWLAQLSPPWMVMAVASLVIVWSASKMLRRGFASEKKTAAQTEEGAARGTQSDRLQGKGVHRRRARSEASPEGAIDFRCDGSSGESASSHPPASSVSPDGCDVSNDEASNGASLWRLSAKRGFAAVLIGAVTGVVAGYAGVGGGFLMVPLMISFLDVGVKHATGTSLVAISFLVLPGALTQFMLGNVAWTLSLAMAGASIPGSLMGARLVQRFDERGLCLFFGGFLLLAASMLLGNEFFAFF